MNPRASQPKIRIFQIGFNKCGTSTLTWFFRLNGVPSVHWHSGKLAARMFDNQRLGRPLIAGYERFRFFADMEKLTTEEYLPAFTLFRTLAAENPDALFILNTRNRKEWLASRGEHGDYVLRYQRVFGLRSRKEVMAHWEKRWLEHHAAVRLFFAENPQYRFVDFNIDGHRPDRLIRAAPELHLEPAHYGRHGARLRGSADA